MISTRGATVDQLYRIINLMIPGRIVKVTSLIGTKNVSRCSDSEEDQWEAMLVYSFTAVWQKFQCAVLIICIIPMKARLQSASARRHNERV